MKLRFLFSVTLFLGVAGQIARPQQAAKPLTKNQVMELVKAGMDSAELAEKVKQVGIDFDLTDDYLQDLRKAGAQDVLIQALRAARPKPLTREQVLQLVVGGVPSERASMLVKQRGIDFVPDQDYLETLRVAGAEEVLLAALRTAGEAATAELEIETSPNAEVFLDGQLAGRASADGRFAVKSKPGIHALKVSLAGNKDFQQNVTLIAGQVNKVAATLAELGPMPGTIKVNPKGGLKYVWIPPGSFIMGCSPGDSECSNAEKPSHPVTLTKGFWIGQTPVTVAAYRRYVGTTGKAMPTAPDFNSGWSDEEMPIVNVSWDDSVAYCTWAGGRLPTEAEWEYAARAGSTESRYGPIDEVAWYSSNSGSKTHDVAQKRANGWNLYDMLGNVLEWVNDWYGGYEHAPSPERDPQGPESGQFRVLSGGSWTYSPRGVRVSNRYRGNPGVRHDYFGFRCVGEVVVP